MDIVTITIKNKGSICLMMRIMVVFLLFFSVLYSLEIYIDRVEKNIQNDTTNLYEGMVKKSYPLRTPRS